jgi:glycosyltransferase involved in cell wall biosynthesis
MKIAVFHNYMDNMGGAEIVALNLAKELNADIYTTNINDEKIKKMGFEPLLSRIHSIGKIPINAPFRQQLALYKFKNLNLKRKYDFYIIAGDWAVSGAVNNRPNLWYVHSPINEIWEFKNHIKNKIISWWQRPIFEAWVLLNRYLTKKYAKNINIWIANSENTKKRIRKYYKKNAEVINPPTRTKDYKNSHHNGFWLSVNRLTGTKRISLQLKAFAKLPLEKLIIVGSYEKKVKQFEKEKLFLSQIMPKNITVKSWVSQEELITLYSKCKGFITTAMDEDFGMTVVEAMASGKPVIAPNEGGYKETVINGITGILIDEITPNKLKEAIEKVDKNLKENPTRYKDACINRAKDFDVKIFIEKIKKSIADYENRHNT